MGKESVSIFSTDEIIKTLATNLHRDLCRLQTSIIKEDKHSIGGHIESAIERSYELMYRVNGSSSLS
jgi:hypothetical protein